MSPKKHDATLRLPPLELQCLQALWTFGEGTVQQLRTHLLSVRPLAYTTVMTVMDRLARKGMVFREKRGRAHLYRPLKAIEDFRQSAVDQIVKDFFGDSRDALVRYLQDGRMAAAASPRTTVKSLGDKPTDRAVAEHKLVKPRRVASSRPPEKTKVEPTTVLDPELL